jgi:hypothetical protein
LTSLGGLEGTSTATNASDSSSKKIQTKKHGSSDNVIKALELAKISLNGRLLSILRLSHNANSGVAQPSIIKERLKAILCEGTDERKVLPSYRGTDIGRVSQ